MPIRWRHPYQDWIVVDQIPHTITGIIDYTTGIPFSDGTGGSSDVNSKSVQYAESWTPGTLGAVGNSPTGGYITISNDNDHAIWPICTGLSDLGFAFRVSASGLGLDEETGENEHDPLEGLGNLQNFTPDFGSPDARDTSNFFGPKIPVKASIEFTYSCRPLLPCRSGVGENIAITKYEASGCGIYLAPVIGVDQLCGQFAVSSPPDSHWIDNNITSTQIVYSGGMSGLLPVITSGMYVNNINTDLKWVGSQQINTPTANSASLQKQTLDYFYSI
jgi:hypothetical protein